MTEDERKKYNEHEQTARRILCIFQAFESMLICLFTQIMPEIDKVQLYYHELSLYKVISMPIAFGVIFLGATFFSWKYKKFFLFWEWLHAVFGIIVFLFGICTAIVFFVFYLIILLILTWRLIVYKKLIAEFTSKIPG